MAELQKYQRANLNSSAVGGGQAGLGNRVTAQGQSDLAARLTNFSNEMFNVARNDAKVSGAEQASKDTIKYMSDVEELKAKGDEEGLAKLKENFKAKGWGVYSKAYDSEASSAYLNTITVQAKEKFDELAVLYADDPEQYLAEYKSYNDETVRNAPTKEIGIVVGQSITKAGSGGYKTLKLKQIAKQKREDMSKSSSAIEIASSDYINAVEQGDFERASILFEDMDVKARASVRDKYTNDDDYAMTVKNTSERGVIAYVNSQFKQGESLDGARGFIQSFKDGEITIGGDQVTFTDEERTVLADRMTYLLDREEKYRDLKTKSNTKQATSDANNLVGDAIKIYKAGKLPDNLNEVEASLPYASPAKQHEAAVYKESYNILLPYKKLSLPEQQAVLAKKQATPDASRVEIEAIAMAKKTLAERSRKVKDDAMGLSFTEGLNSQNVVLFPTGDMAQQAEGFTARLKMQTQNKIEYGETATNLLTKEESEQYSAWLNAPTTSIAEKLDFFDMIEYATKDESGAVYNQLLKKGVDVYAFAGSLVTQGKRDVAKKILKGQEVLKALRNPEEESEMRYKILKSLGNSTRRMGSTDTGSVLGALVSSATALYSAELEITGRFDRGASSSQMKKVITDLTNGVAERNGQSFFLPANTTEDDFNDYIENLKTTDIVPAKGLTAEQTLEVINTGQLNSYAPNSYTVYLGESKLVNADGTPYLIELP